MGTNYYWYPGPACKCCKRPFEPLHIGKSSAGWCFSLHVMPERGIEDLDDWERFWKKEGSYIEDEYGTEITPDSMREIITDRSQPKTPKWTPENYRSNYAEPGPNNLARHRLEAGHCQKHGSGTWDCIIGEFS